MNKNTQRERERGEGRDRDAEAPNDAANAAAPFTEAVAPIVDL